MNINITIDGDTVSGEIALPELAADTLRAAIMDLLVEAATENSDGIQHEPCWYTIKATDTEILEHLLTGQPQCDGWEDPYSREERMPGVAQQAAEQERHEMAAMRREERRLRDYDDGIIADDDH